MKFVLIFLGTAFLLLCFFYFYPAHIFEAKITGIGNEVVVDLSLKNIFFRQDLPAQFNPQNIASIAPTVSGYLILLICTIALPAMVAYRLTMPKKSDDKKE